MRRPLRRRSPTALTEPMERVRGARGQDTMISHPTAAAAFAGLVLAGLTVVPASAAQPAGRSTTQVAEASQLSQPANATESEDDSANCNKQRRRLWIEGEGWIVRRVTICR